jgi:hypothetical protein
MTTTYEVREKGDGEFEFFTHSPEQNGETQYDPKRKASALAYAEKVNGYVVEITETAVIPCQLCGGSGFDKAHQWQDGSYPYCERCEGNGAPASLAALIRSLIADVDGMKLEECPVFDLREDGGEQYEDHWYGGFGEGQYDDESCTFDIQWPCLGILIEQIKGVIK